MKIYGLIDGVPQVEAKRAFAGVPSDISIYGLTDITFPKNNPYFNEGWTFQIDMSNIYLDNLSILYEERNMAGIWEDNINVQNSVVEFGYSTGSKNVIKEEGNCRYNIQYVETNNKEQDEMINSIIDSYVDNNKITELLKKAIQEDPQLKENLVQEDNKYIINIYYLRYANKYMYIQILEGPHDLIDEVVIDLETGNQTTYQEIDKWLRE